MGWNKEFRVNSIENVFKSTKLDEISTVKPERQLPNIPVSNYSYASINN